MCVYESYRGLGRLGSRPLTANPELTRVEEPEGGSGRLGFRPLTANSEQRPYLPPAPQAAEQRPYLPIHRALARMLQADSRYENRAFMPAGQFVADEPGEGHG